MEHQVSQTLQAFTQRYVELWRRETDHPPASAALYGIPSPCITDNGDECVFWLPQLPVAASRLDGVERALDISVHPDAHAFFSCQYAGDMEAEFGDIRCSLLQVWSEEDFIRMQENLIGHLLTQKRLKLSPTLFLASTDSEMTLISLCNISGEVLLEEFGTSQRQVLAPSLTDFLYKLQPIIM
ncbi:SecY-interacting protein [Musicola paradisiaca]|uniref:Protein Syd n=1 Tax=Musicola paradisiaca (strain Ech703) TaxID=579405 RepID=C6CC04_MUSP7|nr:SecY-interacting protein [Musicola paradisiaca]ACS86764.1 Syd family protein [Musicola paradisiaca Ech703]